MLKCLFFHYGVWKIWCHKLKVKNKEVFIDKEVLSIFFYFDHLCNFDLVDTKRERKLVILVLSSYLYERSYVEKVVFCCLHVRVKLCWFRRFWKWRHKNAAFTKAAVNVWGQEILTAAGVLWRTNALWGGTVGMLRKILSIGCLIRRENVPALLTSHQTSCNGLLQGQ